MGAELTEQHRLAQVAIRAAALREVLQVWSALNPLRLDATVGLWLRLMTELLARWWGVSVTRGRVYYQEFRAAEIGEPSATLVVPAPGGAARPPVGSGGGPDGRGGLLTPPAPDPRQVATSLTVTGPHRIRYLTERGVDPDRAARSALRDVSGAAARHVMNGGRSVVDALARADRRAVGWARVTDAHPCAFCAMLASRGYVYLSRATAERTTDRSSRGPGHRYHDHCACVAEPAFTRSATLPGRGEEFARLWRESTAGLSGASARRAFRAAYEGRPPPTGRGGGRGGGGASGPPRTPPERDRRREVTAELAALEKTFADLRRRKQAGEDVAKPHDWQRDRIARLRRELDDLGG